MTQASALHVRLGLPKSVVLRKSHEGTGWVDRALEIGDVWDHGNVNNAFDVRWVCATNTTIVRGCGRSMSRGRSQRQVQKG